MAIVMTTSGAVLVKAGKNVSTDMSGAGAQGLSADAIINKFINEAESYVNVQARTNYSDSYGSLDVDVKAILDDIVSSLAAIPCIQYDMSGYTSRGEAESMITLLRDKATRALKLLDEEKQRTFIEKA